METMIVKQRLSRGPAVNVNALSTEDRVKLSYGVFCSPESENGTVESVTMTRWGCVAKVRMDNGKTESIQGYETLKGIGWKLI